MKNRNDTILRHQYAYTKPYIYKRPSISNICIRILILLSVQLAVLLINKDFNAVFVILSALAGGTVAFLFEFLIKKEPLYNVFVTLSQSFIIGMLLPSSYPLFIVFFLVAITLAATKHIFLNFMNNWANPIALAVIIAWIIGKQFFPDFQITADLISLKNPSLKLIQNGVIPVNTFDSQVTDFFNNSIFKIFHVTVPEGYMSLLWDNHSIIPAFRFNILTILSSIILFADGGEDFLISTLFVITYGLLVRLFVPFFYGGYINSGDVILAVFTSGTLFSALFLLQWFGTVPMTITGRIFYSVTAGILAFFIAGCGTSPIGMCYVILISNLLNNFIRLIEDRKNVFANQKVINIEEGEA